MERRQGNEKFGYMRSFLEPYFSVGYLYSYGGYSFGNNNTDPTDIGYSAGEAEKGGWVIRQLASAMNEWCIDDTITVNAYSKLGDGSYFATMTTPDVYTMFIDEMMKNGMTRAEAEENLVTATHPHAADERGSHGRRPRTHPQQDDGRRQRVCDQLLYQSAQRLPCLCRFCHELRDDQAAPTSCWAIAPARADVAQEIGGLSEVIQNNLEEGNIVIMPSIRENAQMWTPLQTLFTDLAKDPFRDAGEMKYDSLDKIKAALERVDQQVV